MCDLLCLVLVSFLPAGRREQDPTAVVIDASEGSTFRLHLLMGVDRGERKWTLRLQGRKHGLHCRSSLFPYVEYIRRGSSPWSRRLRRFLFLHFDLLLSPLLNYPSCIPPFHSCRGRSLLQSLQHLTTAIMSAIPNLPEQDHHPLERNLDAILDKAIPPTATKRVDSPTNSTFASSNTTSSFTLHDTPIENQRPLKVIVVGAGYSGIYHGIRIPERLRNVDLTIYDKNAGVGGTWFENRYPGCACDIPCKFLSLYHSYSEIARAVDQERRDGRSPGDEEREERDGAQKQKG